MICVYVQGRVRAEEGHSLKKEGEFFEGDLGVKGWEELGKL